MHITFYGAAREVTGSMHLVANSTQRILLDCGMFQGRRKEAETKNRSLPFDPALVSTVVLSHAHIDHSGRLPMLTRDRFNGRILCTRATADACVYLLKDAAHIQESDADYLNYKTVRNALRNMKGAGGKRRRSDVKSHLENLKTEGHRINTDLIRSLGRRYGLETVEPLYTMVDAEKALSFIEGFPYRFPIPLGDEAECRFYEAGHILGSAMAVLTVRENGRPVKIAFTGDIGRYGKPIIRDPVKGFEAEDTAIDLLVMESTYGDRVHEPVGDLKSRIRDVLNETFDRGGSVIIPAFAFGRTQELLYVIHELYNEGAVPRKPVYVDSPLATHITQVFGEHPEVYDRETHAVFLEKGQNPFRFPQVHFIDSVEASMALNRDESPHIVLSASGMCEAGRVLHHLRHKIHNPKHTVLIVGYMAEHTLGRRIQELGLAWAEAGRSGPAPVVRFLNKEYPLKAHVVKIGGFSAHADREELMRFLAGSNLRVKKIAVVHGEEDQALSFAEHLKRAGHDVFVPRRGETLHIP